MFKVLLDLLQRPWYLRCEWCDCLNLAQQLKKPIKSGAIADRWAAVSSPVLLILLNGTLIHRTNIKALAGKPTTEITDDANAARPALITVSFAE
jgi:hypothetical protein